MPTQATSSDASRSRFNVGNFLAHHDTHPLTLAAALTSNLGAEWVFWEPETLRDSLEDQFNRSEVSTLNWDKIQAVRTCLVSTSAWKSWSVFSVVSQPLNNNIVVFQTFQRPTPAQCANAVEIKKELGSEEYDDEVGKLIAASFLYEGIVYLPPPLEFAQRWATEPRYKCNDCGWVGDDFDQDVCWNCSSATLSKFVTRDPEPIKKRYDQIIAQMKETGDHDMLTEDRAEDVQTARLLVVHNYLEHRKKQLEEQVKVLHVSSVSRRTRHRGRRN